MSLFQKIQDDLKTALKGGDQFTVDVLRFINSSFHNKAIEKRGQGQAEELNNSEVIEVLQKEVKKRQEAAALYRQGSRPELAEKEEKEIFIIQKYLPAQMSREEIEKEVTRILTMLNIVNFGEAMKAVLAELKGKADAKVISEIVKQIKPDL